MPLHHTADFLVDPLTHRYSGKCFQIMGFDVLLDKTGRAHLLEVNANPSMSIDSVHELPSTVSTSPVSMSNYSSRREGGGICRSFFLIHFF